MLTLALLGILAIGFYTGYKRGFALQVIYTVGYFFTYLIAKIYYQDLADKLELFVPYPSPTMDTKLAFFDQRFVFDLDKAFYAAVAFLLLTVAGWIVVRFIGIFTHKLTFIPILKQANGLVGGLLNFAVLYIGLFLLLFALSMLPVDALQQQLENSWLASTMIEKTPVFSKQIYQLWVTQTLSGI